MPSGFLNDARSGRQKWILPSAMSGDLFLLGPLNLGPMGHDAD